MSSVFNAGRPAIRLGLIVLVAAIVGGPSAAAQTRRLNQVMREKLEHSKNILESLVTSNWQQLERESRELARATEDPAWSVLTMPDYMRQSAAFLHAIESLIDAAERHDLEGASLGYVSLTTSCVSCHRYVARARMVK
jgi:hypothetical protein